jgi:acylphosphatase
LSLSQISFKVTGKVQGVFFRDFAQRTAKEAGLTGWVRNASDGSVVGEIQGPADKVDTYEKGLHQGSRHSRVDGVEATEKDVDNTESSFQVKY